MGVATHIQSALDGLATELGTAIDTALTDIASDGGPTLTPIAVVEVTDREDPDRLPHVGITYGGVEVSDYMTTQRDEIVDLVVTLTHVSKHTPTGSYSDANYYGRAVDLALTRRATAVAGIFHIDVTGIGPSTKLETDRFRRRVAVEADLYIRTDRGE